MKAARKIITLSFDDGEIYDMQLTALLREYKLQATFYLCSGFDGDTGMCGNGRIYRKMKLDDVQKTYDGFEIGSHSYLHRGVLNTTSEEITENIRKDIELFSSYVSRPIQCFAYPGGDIGNTAIEVLSQLDQSDLRELSLFPITVSIHRRTLTSASRLRICLIPTWNGLYPDLKPRLMTASRSFIYLDIPMKSYGIS